MGLSKAEYSQLKSTINLGLQSLHILRRFPGFIYRRERSVAVWRGTLQPRQFSPKYRVAVRYRLSSYPTVNVIFPTLAPKAPHLWKDGSFCLYYPKEKPWRKDMLIAETIIPWTALWLYYYELWLDTGEWLGPSSHASDSKLLNGTANSALE
ncbi:hypothetical protein HW132_00850 [Brasilonema sp. CT11]|nr:hypothetical protein [Brasilonema sp. CT11]